ncbi:hypothetical protein DL95DRAFT_376832 [Leptodontidium sp. 2 PMI_412]|nr:hypothetical protein DL95DRAFT_376832 [Leptodontidium sp. 2 PMI_412]
MSTSTPSIAKYRCAHCPAIFVRMEHRRRHETKREWVSFPCFVSSISKSAPIRIDDGQRLCVCEFCDAQFHRRDILRRHYKTCKLRGAFPIPTAKKRGRPREACDHCAALKLGCDSGRPCQACQDAKCVCSSERIRETESSNQTVPMQDLASENAVFATSPSVSTLSQAESPVAAVVSGSRRPPASLDPAGFRRGIVTMPFIINLCTLDTRTFPDAFGYSKIAPELSPSSMRPVVREQRSSFWNSMSTRGHRTGYSMNELVIQLTNTYINLPRGHFARSKNVQISNADTFLTDSNFKLFAQTYLHHFYPHCPVIHRVPFEPEASSLRLILVICLGGALYSSLRDENLMAASLLDLAEEFIFQHPCFRRIGGGDVNGCWGSSQGYESPVQALQAAVTITFLQSWGGNETARRRIRTDRFAMIVSTARKLDLMSTHNPIYADLSSEPPHTFDWHQFIDIESRLRLAYYIFSLDSIFCTLYNHPLRLAVAELTADLPCSDETFFAPSSELCLQSACEEKPAKPPSLRTVLSSFLGNERASSGDPHPSMRLTTLHFFIIIQAIHITLWTSRRNLFLESAIDTIEHALSRWSALWTIHKSSIQGTQFRRLGLVRHAVDFWHYAMLLLHISETNSNGSGNDSSLSADLSEAPYEDDGMSYVRQLLVAKCGLEED